MVHFHGYLGTSFVCGPLYESGEELDASGLSHSVVGISKVHAETAGDFSSVDAPDCASSRKELN